MVVRNIWKVLLMWAPGVWVRRRFWGVRSCERNRYFDTSLPLFTHFQVWIPMANLCGVIHNRESEEGFNEWERVMEMVFFYLHCYLPHKTGDVEVHIGKWVQVKCEGSLFNATSFLIAIDLTPHPWAGAVADKALVGVVEQHETLSIVTFGNNIRNSLIPLGCLFSHFLEIYLKGRRRNPAILCNGKIPTCIKLFSYCKLSLFLLTAMKDC